MPTPMPSGNSPPVVYRLLIRVLSPLICLYTLWRTAKDGGPRYFKERFGFYIVRDSLATNSPSQAKGLKNENTSNNATRLWIHAASVGEVITVLPLLKAWLNKHTDAFVIFTTGTPTGAMVLDQQNIKNVVHHYLPIDFPGACQRFLKQANVKQGWIVETEIWPWLFTQCQQWGTELTIVNGRLSNKTTAQSTGFLASSYKTAIKHVRILARSELDKNRFLSLGAQPELITIAGNLKNIGPVKPKMGERIVDQNYVLAASTHDDEEIRLCVALRNFSCQCPLLIIAPRHPERGSEIREELIGQGFKVAQRSLHEPVSNDCEIYIADTLGELDALYQHALGAFVGGSLIERGGHNLIEPARYACPTIVGPHTFNFFDTVSHYLDGKAIMKCQNEQQVADFLYRASQSDEELKAMGLRAKRLAEKDNVTALKQYQRLLF